MTRTKISVPGLARNLKILHVTDTHIARADEGSVHEANSRARIDFFRKVEAMDYESKSIAVLGKASDPTLDAVLLSGDIVDFPSKASLEMASGFLTKCTAPKTYISGNHDWNFPGQISTAALRDENLPLLKPLFGNRPAALFDRLEIAGLQILSVDNSTYQIQPAQLKFVQEQLGNSKPTILLMHIPMSQPALKIKTIAKWRQPILMGEEMDESIKRDWGIERTVRQTREFIELTKSAENLRAILCGHVHFEHEERWSERAVQYVTGPGFLGYWREIEAG